MEQSTSRYYFRKRDYLKIRNWYEMASFNYIPEDTQQQSKKSQKSKEWHFKFQFNTIQLAEEYVNSNLKNLNNTKQIIILTSIFQRTSGYVLSYGRQLAREGQFRQTTNSIQLGEEIVLYFYLDDVTPRDYELCLQLQLVTKEGVFLRLATARYSLNLSKEATIGKFLLYSHNRQQFDLDQGGPKVKPTKKDAERTIYEVGVIEVEQQLQEIKDISKYLPQLKIIDQESKLPPAVNFNLKKKKEQMVIEPPYKITLEGLLIKILNPTELKRQILNNNPFTMSHKELVQFEIKEYTITLDMHNGWKFMNQYKNVLPMELVVENQQEIYVSSKMTEKLNLGYYDHEGALFVIILTCKANFKIKEGTQRRSSEFVIGWLPLPIDLSLKDNKIDMFFVNDHPFPTSPLPHLSVQSNFTANFIHPLYQKYKPKQEDRRVLMNELPIAQSGSSQPNRVIKMINSKNNRTEITSSHQLAEREEAIDTQILNLKRIIVENQKQFQKNRMTIVTGRPDKGEAKVNEPCELNMEECVGRILKVKLQLKSIIPQTDVPSLYFLPRKLSGQLYFLRQKYDFNFHLTQSQVKYHIPVSLNCTKSSFSFKINLASVQQYHAITNSRLVLVLYQQNASMIYCKGVVDFIEILGRPKIENISYLRLNVWNQDGQKFFGTVLINSIFQLEKVKQNYKKVQEIQYEKELQKLPMQERLKMRIGNFKGDNDIKSKAVSMIKQKKHGEYVSNVVECQLLSDGEIFYELGYDSYHLLSFTNEDKSENNVFTLHLNCPFAELVTNEQDFRSISSFLNVQLQNYKHLQFVIKDKSQSYYQTTLQFNQSIGLLIKLNVNQFKQGFSLKKIELVVKRNTLETKRFVLKCTYREPLIWQAFQCHDLLQNQEIEETRIAMIEEVASKFKDIAILNESIKIDYRSQEIVILKKSLSSLDLFCLATPNYSKIRKIILLKLRLWPGTSIEVFAGQKVKPSIDYQNKHPIQIIRTQSTEIHIPQFVRFNIPTEEPFDDVQIQLLRPVKNRPLFITTHDLSGQRLWSFLIKATALLPTNSEKIELSQIENISFSFQCENPYACKSKFTVFSSSNSLKLSESEMEINRYDFKTVFGRIAEWNMMESSLFIFLNDERGNIIQAIEVTISSKESIIYQNT